MPAVTEVVGSRAAFKPRAVDLQVLSLAVNEIAETHLTELMAERGDAQGKQRLPVRVTGAGRAKSRALSGGALRRLRTRRVEKG